MLFGVLLPEWQSLVRGLNLKNATLHRFASQRENQANAKWTSMSAAFVAGGADDWTDQGLKLAALADAHHASVAQS